MHKMNVTAEPGKQDIILTRTFDAPRALVFQAYTDPKLIPQWWGPRKYKTIVDRMELKKGGIWRYINRGSDGQEFAFNGVYHEIAAPERLLYTYEFEGMPPGRAGIVTITFEEQNGKTLLTDKSLFQSVEDRDAVVQSGMEQGAAETFDRFEELLSKMK